MIEKVSLPESSNGPWVIEHFTVSESEAELEKLRGAFNRLTRLRKVPSGRYTRLVRRGRCINGSTVVMSDTPAEMRDHAEALKHATGHCLINGLGLGMFLAAVLAKPDVESVTVVEVDQDLIDLVGPHYARDPRLTIVNADAMTFRPPRNMRYQMVWHDIWDNITADNLDDMKTLHRRYGRRSDWQGSWCRTMCEWHRDGLL